MKTLIVDDELTSRELLTIILKPYGPVDTAVDGLEGLKVYNLALGREPYDLIMLGGVTGYHPPSAGGPV